MSRKSAPLSLNKGFEQNSPIQTSLHSLSFVLLEWGKDDNSLLCNY